MEFYRRPYPGAANVQSKLLSFRELAQRAAAAAGLSCGPGGVGAVVVAGRRRPDCLRPFLPAVSGTATGGVPEAWVRPGAAAAGPFPCCGPSAPFERRAAGPAVLCYCSENWFEFVAAVGSSGLHEFGAGLSNPGIGLVIIKNSGLLLPMPYRLPC